jgi:amino acid adenylation domain-containing protein
MQNSYLDSSIPDNDETLEGGAEDVFLFPLSFAQQRLWFLQQMNPQSPAYNMPVASRLLGKVNVKALDQALNEIVQRHEVLRTTFQMVDAQPMQVISSGARLVLPLLDLTHLPETVRETEAHRLAVENLREPFDLVNGPLVRAVLVRLDVEDHLLLLAMHHIISDGWSISVLVNELAQLYNAFSIGAPSTLPDLHIQYADYAQWQRSWLTGEVFEAQLDYWKKQLDGAPPILEVPTDRPRPSIQSSRGSLEHFSVAEDVVRRLREICQQEGATMFMVLLAAFQTLLHRYARQDVIVVGTPIAGRNRQELEGLIGFFINTLVMRADFSDDLRFRGMLAHVKETALGAYAHQEFPFDKLVEELQPERDLSHMPIIQAMFALQNTPDESIELAGLVLTPVNIESGTTQFDLSLNVWDKGPALKGYLAYCSDLFDAGTIKRMLAHFQTLLESIANDPDQRVSELSLLTEEEERQVLLSSVAAQSETPVECLHHLFEAQVERTPGAIALSFENTQMTYAELNQRADQLAHQLRALGVGPEVSVGLSIERSLELVIGILGILKAGGAYVPLDPSYPPERLRFMIDDAKPAVVLGLDEKFSRGGAAPQRDERVVAPLRRCVGNPAYVIYTSGSTGTPKGVVVTHANVVRLFDATRRWFDFNENDVWTLFHSFAFDFSVWELWGALLYGGRLVIVPHFVSRSPEAFHELLSREKVTVLNQTPSAFRQLMKADEAREDKLALRYVIFGGEALELQSLKPWFERHGDRRPQLVNMYGITETTVHVTYRLLTAADLDSTRGSRIGAPIPDLSVYILDRHLQPAPDMLPGELYVGGDGVARGYLNRAELTAERFIPDPFGREAGARLYRTGDLARRLGNGDIEYLGRADDQVKIRGFRIEPGEIETALLTHRSLQAAVVVARPDNNGGINGDWRLCAYIVARQSAELRIDELRAHLRERLPEHMLPAVFVELEEIPLTPHGKLDKKNLPEPGRERPEFEKRYEAARNGVEAMLSELWSDVLGVEHIGIHDDFFDLGGDSIKGVIFINRLQQHLGEIVHVVNIFNAPTIASFAKYMEEQHPDAVTKIIGSPLRDAATLSGPEQVLVSIQPQGSLPPFFCVHAVGGNVFSYVSLARRLGPAQPFYALQARGLMGAQEPHTRIEEMATDYIQAIRAAQESGPYALGGWSMGGLVAFEMACQLQRRGLPVALVALFDSITPYTARFRQENEQAMQVANFAFQLGLPPAKLANISEQLLSLDEDSQLKHLFKLAEKSGIFPKGFDLTQLRDLFKVYRSNNEAVLAYQPRPCSAPLVLFCAEETMDDELTDTTYGWSQLALGSLAIEVVKGNHFTMLDEPHVSLLAQKLRVHLARRGSV